MASIGIEPKYDEVLFFKDGLAPVAIVKKDGKKQYGYINRKGKLVIKPQFDEANTFSDGKAMVFWKQQPTEEKLTPIERIEVSKIK